MKFLKQSRLFWWTKKCQSYDHFYQGTLKRNIFRGFFSNFRNFITFSKYFKIVEAKSMKIGF